jgi:hypothetical protein
LFPADVEIASCVMTLVIPRAAYMAGRRRPIRGNLLVKAGVIGVGTVRPRHGKVVITAGTRIRVTGGSAAESRPGRFAAISVLAFGAGNSPNPAYVAIPLTNGSDMVFRVDGTAAEVLATQLRRELAPLGASVTVG